METKNKVWLLTLTTNVNAEKILHVDEGKEKRYFWIFSSFEKAKESMQQLISAYGNTPNIIFDGHGLCTDFEEYMDERRSWEQYTDPYEYEVDDELNSMWGEFNDGYDDSAKCFWDASKLPKILKAYLSDVKNFSSETIPTNTWTDYLIGCSFSPEKIFIEGVDDGPCNGIDPYILINTFNMDNPDKEYVFRFRNAFGEGWDYIYIDMMSSEIDEEFGFPLH